ncbi:MAG: M90 family metallopeptidase [Planctomycetales bacterium]
MIFSWWRSRRRRRIFARPFPDDWRDGLREDFPQYAWLDDAERSRLERIAQVLVAEKYWEGCAGFEIDDRVRVAIAAQAAMLLLGFDDAYYDSLTTVLVYPDTYVAPDAHMPGGGLVIEGHSPRLGEAWHRGPVILSWPDVLDGARIPDDGHNVVFHEFAHVLDMEDGLVDGTPRLGDRRLAAEWAAVMSDAQARLRRAARRGTRTFLDDYGTRDEAEFFAVATESFFEQPERMARNDQALYDLLSRFYRQDPIRRVQAARQRGPKRERG